MIYPSFRTILLCFGATTMLAACGSTQGTGPIVNGAPPHAVYGADAAREEAEHKLPALQRTYDRDKSNESAAIAYAIALRELGNAGEAADIVRPFIRGDGASAAALAEYAAIQNEISLYQAAENYARKALSKDKGNAKAYYYMGLALEAQGFHKESEHALREALENKHEEERVDVMNSLALNLASQGRADEAAELLEHAKELAPQRLDIERNLRIVRALQQSSGHSAPKPPVKPDIKPEVAKKKTENGEDDSDKKKEG